MLVDDQRYCLSDVGMMFGISRERVRQLCMRFQIGRHGHNTGLKQRRIWNDSKNIFESHSVGALVAEQKKAKRARRIAERRARIEARMADATNVLIALGEILQRTPTTREIADALCSYGLNTASLYAYLRPERRTDNSGIDRAVATALFKRAGMFQRAVGQPGHLMHESAKPVKRCKKHDIELNSDTAYRIQHKYWSCKLCHRHAVKSSRVRMLASQRTEQAA